MENYKLCTSCKQLLLLDFFSFSEGRPRSKCKSCRSEEQKKRYAKNPEYTKNYNQVNKERRKPVLEAWRAKTKYERRIKDQARVAKNPDKYREKARTHRQNNRSKYVNYYHTRKARMSQGGTYKVKSQELDNLLSAPCFYCGKKSETIDHIIPLSRGGRHSIGNLIGSCKNCNFTKNNKFLTEWLLYKKKLKSFYAQRPRPGESP